MVRDGQIVDSFYSLIQPEPNYYNYWCQRVHGISESDTIPCTFYNAHCRSAMPLCLSKNFLPLNHVLQ